jgi:hypothetical protein
MTIHAYADVLELLGREFAVLRLVQSSHSGANKVGNVYAIHNKPRPMQCTGLWPESLSVTRQLQSSKVAA